MYFFYLKHKFEPPMSNLVIINDLEKNIFLYSIENLKYQAISFTCNVIYTHRPFISGKTILD